MTAPRTRAFESPRTFPATPALAPNRLLDLEADGR